MRRFSAAALLLIGLAACGGGETNNAANSANVAAQEGIDPNMMIGGDEISPIPEAEDDMAANAANGVAPAPAGNQSAPPANGAAPLAR